MFCLAAAWLSAWKCRDSLDWTYRAGYRFSSREVALRECRSLGANQPEKKNT